MIQEIADFGAAMADLHERSSVAITAIEQRLASGGTATTLSPEDRATLDKARSDEETRVAKLEELAVPNP